MNIKQAGHELLQRARTRVDSLWTRKSMIEKGRGAQKRRQTAASSRGGWGATTTEQIALESFEALE